MEPIGRFAVCTNMESSRQTETQFEATDQPRNTSSTLAKALAPEDVRMGDFVTLLHEFTETPSYYWYTDSSLEARNEVVRMRCLPSADGGTPLQVESICLPFILVKHPSGEVRSIDLRRFRVARLTNNYASQAWKAFGSTAAAPGQNGNQGDGDFGFGIVSTDDVS
jgi:hypothetical protein